jgi:hypothetical protein
MSIITDGMGKRSRLITDGYGFKYINILGIGPAYIFFRKIVKRIFNEYGAA